MAIGRHEILGLVAGGRSAGVGHDAPTSAHARFYPDDLGPVGSATRGRARWGQLDMGGNVWEWALDWLDPSWYEDAGDPCENCANVAGGSHRVLRGGAYSFEEVTLRAATRSAEEPATRRAFVGVRCARNTQG
ncbi:MAG TPA: SUMF1/EgtB/PvdO family nonheme iron enzyme [Polyangiaceae bacterium]